MRLILLHGIGVGGGFCGLLRLLLLLLLHWRLLLLTKVEPLLTVDHGYREVLFIIVGLEVE